MRSTVPLLVLAFGVTLAAGCSTPHVTTDYSPEVSFSRYHTFALVAPPDTGVQPLLDQRVRMSVRGQLIEKGLTEVERDQADLFVGYGMVDKTHKEIYTDNTGWGWGRGWGWRYYRWGVAWPMTVRSTIETYTDGTVVVNLIDAKTRQVVWQAEAADVIRLPVSNPASATHKVSRAVAALFQKFPPRGEGA